MSKIFECIQRSKLLKSLPNNIQVQLSKNIQAHEKFYKKDSLIYDPTSKDPGMLVIDKGLVKVYQISKNGDEQILYFLRKNSIDGQERLFKKLPINSFAETLSDTTICTINHYDFQKMIQKSPDLATAILNNLGSKLIEIETNSTRKNIMDAKQRTIASLKDFAKSYGNKFKLPMPKKELANYLGISPETLSRQLKKLIKEEQIKVNNSNISILE